MNLEEILKKALLVIEEVPPLNGMYYNGLPEALALSKQEEFEKKYNCKLKFLFMRGRASNWERI